MVVETGWYDLLGVKPDASTEEISKAYKRGCIKFHPDKIVGATREDEERFKEFVLAYETLTDPKRRFVYDSFGSQGMPEDVAKKLEEHTVDQILQVSLQEAYRGGERSFQTEVPVLCEACKGNGGENRKECNECKGRGVCMAKMGGLFLVQVPCKICKSKGFTVSKPCKNCKGEASFSKNKTINLTIPPRSCHGSVVTYDQGVLVKTPSGDFYAPINFHIEIADDKDERFELVSREGVIKTNLDIDTIDALIGFRKGLTLIDGSQISVGRNEQSVEGDFLILPGMGLGEAPMHVYLRISKAENIGDVVDLIRENRPEIDWSCTPSVESGSEKINPQNLLLAKLFGR